jgi:phosphotransferase system HPr (HPr) family protein
MSKSAVKRSTVRVPWREGLHLRPAARLVRIAQRFRSSISLTFGGKVADVRSILNIIALCATMGAALDIEVLGDDEQNAIAAVEQEFRASGGEDAEGDLLKER